MPDISTLADLVGPQCLITDPDVMDRFLHDDAEWAPYETALAVLRPHDKQQVVAAVKTSSRSWRP